MDLIVGLIYFPVLFKENPRLLAFPKSRLGNFSSMCRKVIEQQDKKIRLLTYIPSRNVYINALPVGLGRNYCVQRPNWNLIKGGN